MAAVEMPDGERSHIHIVQTTHIHVDLIRIGARNVKWMYSARGAKGVLGDTGIETVCRQRIFAAYQLEGIRRHDEMEKAFFAADRAIAFRHAREVGSDTKAHVTTMATARHRLLHNDPAYVRRQSSNIIKGGIVFAHDML